jgi:hypothetical protein
MFRPFFVRERARKPCLLARLRLLGWYVRFMISLGYLNRFRVRRARLYAPGPGKFSARRTEDSKRARRVEYAPRSCSSRGPDLGPRHGPLTLRPAVANMDDNRGARGGKPFGRRTVWNREGVRATARRHERE